MPAFFIEPSVWEIDPALTGDEARHCMRVMRVRVGEEIDVFDGAGRGARAKVTSLSRDRVSLELEKIFIEPLPQARVILGQAVIKGKGMEWLIQKAVELGVSVIQPIQSEHVVVKAGSAQLEKWRRIAREACKQCGRKRIPEIAEVAKLSEWVNGLRDGLQLAATLQGEQKNLREVLRSYKEAENPSQKHREIFLLIGPEGDFSSAEMDAISESSWQSVSLGDHVLRSETAALYCLTAIRYEFS